MVRGPTIGEMRMEQAEFLRDAKKEGSKCAFGTCTTPAVHDAPDGWSGPYGGTRLCQEHMETVVDRLLDSIIEGTDPYWEQ